MFRLTLRTAGANLTRSLLSTLAVVLGVAFVSGTLMFTDGLKSTMTAYAAVKYRNIDVQVALPPARDLKSQDALVERVRRIDGVRAADATSTVFDVGLAAGDGRKIGGEHRAVNVPADPALRPFEASTLAARIGGAVDAEALTNEQLVRSAVDRAVGDAEDFRNALLSFGAIAVSMAAFVIANTFTIVLAQRSRDTALLRLLGATRRQVFHSAITEAAAIGLGGSLIGLAVGVLLAHGLPAVLTAVGSSAQISPVVSGRTVILALAVGTGVTVLSALLPARRGTRVAPVTALSEAAVHVARPISRSRRISGILALTVGIAALVAADSANEIWLPVAGMLVTVLGFLLLSPDLVPAVVRVVGRPIAAVGGATVRLALANAVRNPRRIATTTNALVVGVTLVATFALIAESSEAPAERAADEKLFAQFLVLGNSDWSVLPLGVLDALRQQPELGPAVPLFQAFDPGSGYEVDTGRGNLGPAAAVVSADLGIAAGGTVTIRGRDFTVASVAPAKGSTAPTVWLTAQNITELFDEPRLAEVQVDPAPGVPAADARAAVDRALLAFPSVVAYDHAEYAASLNATLNQALAVVTALLALAVIIALIGVANTLTLSVVERTRENALLRAIGLTRRQLRHTLSAEALVMALTGTLIGILVSIGVALAYLGAIDKKGSGTDLAVPWDQLGGLLAVAVLAALAASVLPARRAIRIPVAATLAAE